MRGTGREVESEVGKRELDAWGSRERVEGGRML